MTVAALLGTAVITAQPILADPAPADANLAPTREEPTLTLAQCLHEALTQPDQVQQQTLTTDEAQQGINAIKGSRITVRGTAQAQATSDDRISATSNDGTIISRERARVGLSASLPLYDGGRRSARLGIAEDRLKSALATTQTRQQATLQDTTDAYYAVLSRQRLQEAGQLQLQAAQETLTAAQARYALGAVTRGDVLAAQSVVSQAEAEQQSRALGLEIARSRLALLIGRDPLHVAPIVVEPPLLPAPAGSVDQLLTQYTTRSPERAVLVIRQDSAAQESRSIRAEHTPQVTLSGSAGAVASHSSRLYATVGVELSVPLLDGAAFHARQQEAKDAQDLSAIALREFDRTSRERVLSAALDYSATQQKIAPSQAAVDAATESYRLAQGRYQAGKGIQQEVLQALIGLTQSRERLAVALDERNAAAEALARLTGAEDPSAYLSAPPSK